MAGKVYLNLYLGLNGLAHLFVEPLFSTVLVQACFSNLIWAKKWAILSHVSQLGGSEHHLLPLSDHLWIIFFFTTGSLAIDENFTENLLLL